MVSENYHVSYTGIWYCMDTNIFHGPSSSISGAVAVHIFQDFDQYSIEAELLDNYKQLFEHRNKLFNMYHAVSLGAGSNISSRPCAAAVGLLKKCSNCSCYHVLHVSFYHMWLTYQFAECSCEIFLHEKFRRSCESWDSHSCVADFGFTFWNITVPYRRSIRKIPSTIFSGP